MAYGLKDTGEEYFMDKLDGESFDILLFDDSTDELNDEDDVGDITTEPSTGNYTRQNQTFNSADALGDWEIATGTTTFDVTDTSQTVYSYGVVVNFQSEGKNDGSANDHLLFTGALSQSRDLSQIDTLNVDNISGVID